MTKATTSGDGTLRVNVRVTFRLGLDDLACLLADHWDFDPNQTMSLAKVRECVIEKLAQDGDGIVVSDVADEYTDWDERFPVAQTLVARAFGFPLPS